MSVIFYSQKGDKSWPGLRIMCACFALGFCMAGPGYADDEPTPEESWKDKFSYGKQGLQFDDGTGNTFLWFGVRLQSRWANTEVVQDSLPGEPVSDSPEVAINRGRLKLGGHLVRPAFTIYSEYDIVDSRLLDLRATYKFADWLSVRVGQWKAEYNRDRIDSSGKQQFAERSIITPWFTVDRQQGVMASGRLGESSRADTSYWLGWLSGAGRGGDRSEADGLWLARAQWNFNGRVLGFSQSALARPEQPAGSVTVAAVTGRSGYTAFSSSGGGQLPGVAQGEPDQYRIEQFMVETAYHLRGFSWQQEFHWKTVTDKLGGEKIKLTGGYAQAGMFFSEVFESFPEPLELAARVAYVDPDYGVSGGFGGSEKEITLGSNWFFNGHRNKLTLDLSRLTLLEARVSKTSNRVRIQWEWSF